MDEKRNIVIVGGGIIGCTTAYYLTRHPKFNPALHTITLLEAAPTVAAGASGKAGGLLALWAYPSCLVPLSYKLHNELATEHDGAQKWGYRQLTCGSFEATVSKSRLDEMKKAKDEGKAWEKLPKQDDAAKELLEPGALPQDLDWVDRDSISGAIAELAQKAGVELRTHAKVTKLVTSKTAVEKVEYQDRTTNETREVRDVTDVIVTAGPWTGRLLPRAKVEGLRAHSVVYEAEVTPYAVFTDIQLPSNFVPDHRAKMGQRKMHKGSVDPEIYARPFGEANPTRSSPYQKQQTRFSSMRRSATTSSPTLPPLVPCSPPHLSRQSKPATCRGTCGSGKKSGPLLGRTTVPGLWVAAGHTCWGIQNGPATGKLMSEYIFDGEATSANVEKLDPRKFKV
ncbi:hypothetical protein ACCO45_007946 [Purpureocillium lilacinum]|uniref:Uncharacterized protein n=1 Tax=Purpureocillium lilacinum TaxID=33203 RepID=A0ACC4DQ04_PURLI